MSLLAKNSWFICCLEYVVVDQMYLEENSQADGEPTAKFTCFSFLSFAHYGNASQYEHTCLYLTPLVLCVLCCEQLARL